MEIKPRLDALEVGLAAVGSGSPEGARRFIEAFGFGGEMYLDPGLSVYRAFGLKRGIVQTIGISSLFKGITALKDGFRQGGADGDLWQQGGLFVMGPGERVIFSHRDQFAGDHADLHRVLEALEA